MERQNCSGCKWINVTDRLNACCICRDYDQYEKSDREKAIEWWNRLSSLRQTQLCDTHTELVGSVRRRETLTGREIEQIWRKETQ